jgi:hypothetical protein
MNQTLSCCKQIVTSLTVVQLIDIIHSIKGKKIIEDPRWQLERGSRQHKLSKSKILQRCWSHTWQEKKPPRRGKL